MFTYKNIQPFGLLVGIMLMVVGLVFLFVPDRIAEFLAIFVGAIISVFGIFRIIAVAAKWHTIAQRSIGLAVGVIILLIGLFMLFNPDVTITLTGAIIGLIAIMLGIDRLIIAYKLKQTTNITPTVISGLIHLAFGVGMLYSAIAVFAVIIVLIGIYLLVSGVMFTLSALFFRDF
ncbi:MAG: DUF308 domain-containing protein [Bacillota bacterium]